MTTEARNNYWNQHDKSNTSKSVQKSLRSALLHLLSRHAHTMRHKTLSVSVMFCLNAFTVCSSFKNSSLQKGEVKQHVPSPKQPAWPYD